MKTMKENDHNLNLKCDVLLLADVFEKFRNNSTSHYLSASALSWDTMLNMTKVKFELDMCIFFEKGVRSGVSYVSNKYSKGSNKYLKSYDPKPE